MTNLLITELFKLIHKKSIYIILIILEIFIIINNIIIYKDSKNNDKDYLEKAQTIYEEYKDIKEDSNYSYQEKIDYIEKEKALNISKYILDTKQNINKSNTLNYQLRTVLEDYELFIVLLIIIISSTIYAEEYHKGTIKLLLIKPYKRYKIIISKFLSCLIILLASILILVFFQLLTSFIFFDISSLSQKVVIYNYQKSTILCYNIFIYMLIRIISKLPMLIFIILLALFISIITTSSTLTIVLTILIYIFTNVINNLAIDHSIKIMRYLPMTNWNFTEYLFGNYPKFEYINLPFSIIIMIIYTIVIIILTLLIFNNKDIKNI